MEIRTARKPNESKDAEIVPPPDKARYLRRQSPQTLRKSHRLNRLVRSVLRVAGRLGVILFVSALVAGVILYAYNSDRFSLQLISVRGSVHLDAQQLKRSLLQDLANINILRIDLEGLKRRVERETWVRRADIRRVLPSELVIDVVERTPAAIVELQPNLMLADEEGRLLDEYDARHGKLDVPVFRGLMGETARDYRLHQDENALRVALGLRLVTELESGSPLYTRNISEVDLSNRQNVRLTLVDETAEIQIGDRDFLKRFRTLMDNMNQFREVKAQHAEIASVDLRFDGQIVYVPRKMPDGGAEDGSAARPPKELPDASQPPISPGPPRE